MITKLAPYAKAVGSFIVGLAAFATVVIATLADNHISASEAVTIVAALGSWLGSTGVVYQLANTPSIPVQPIMPSEVK